MLARSLVITFVARAGPIPHSEHCPHANNAEDEAGVDMAENVQQNERR